VFHSNNGPKGDRFCFRDIGLTDGLTDSTKGRKDNNHDRPTDCMSSQSNSIRDLEGYSMSSEK